MSSYSNKKTTGSTSSTSSMDSVASVKMMEAPAHHSNSVRVSEAPHREPLRPKENVLKPQNNVVRTENSITKVSTGKMHNFNSSLSKVDYNMGMLSTESRNDYVFLAIYES